MNYREIVSLFDRKEGRVVEHMIYAEPGASFPEVIVYEHPTGPGRCYRNRYTIEEARAVVAALQGAIEAAGEEP